MSYDDTIKNMEQALEKKKEQRAERNAAKIAKLKERIKAKNDKAQKLNDEVTALNTECADLMSDQNVAGVIKKVEPFVAGSAVVKGSQDKKTPAKNK
jgi:uncharacterized protein YlxW (UPF0749 family)